MKSLVWQRNRHQKVFYRLKARGLYICAVGLDILIFEQTSLFYSAYLNSWGLELCFGGAKRPSKTSHGYGTVWQNFSLLLNTTDRKST